MTCSTGGLGSDDVHSRSRRARREARSWEADGDDTPIGDPGRDGLDGVEGNDIPCGGGGGDTLGSGAGNDTIDGGEGRSRHLLGG
jgi:Ca2+-binding RTX toxin-like protein